MGPRQCRGLLALCDISGLGADFSTPNAPTVSTGFYGGLLRVRLITVTVCPGETMNPRL